MPGMTGLLAVSLLLALLAAERPGQAAAVAPVTITFLQAGGQAKLSRYEESAQRVSFVIEADAPVRLRLAPAQFRFVRGAEYSINTSYYDPWFQRAAAEGELVLDLDRPRNCTVVVEEAKGGELAASPSFEQVAADGLPTGWRSRIGGAPSPGRPQTGSACRATDEAARTGTRSLCMTKGEGEGWVEAEQTEGVPVQEDTVYLIAAYYRLAGARHGSQVSLSATVNAPGKDPLRAEDEFLTPLVVETPGGWRRTFFTLQVPRGYRDARLRVRLTAAGSPFAVWWDDLSVRVAPSPAPQHTPPLTPIETKPRYSPEEVHALMGGRPSVRAEPPVPGVAPLRVNGESVHLFAYASHPDIAVWPALSAHRDFLDRGVRLHFVPAHAAGGWHHEDSLWLDDGVYDFSPLDRRLETMLGYDPDACVLLYMGLEPYPAFGDRHPEARWVNAFGQATIGEKENWRPATELKPEESWNISYTAPAYRRETAAFMRALGRHLATSDVGKAVVGVHLAGGTDGQWFVHGWGRDFGDFDRSMGALESFRGWLRARYHDDLAAFRRAWGDPEVTFESATMPAEQERAPERYFLDSGKGEDCRLIDANLFEQEGVAESINLFARAFKEGLGRAGLVTTYYPKKHYALRVLLDQPDVDGVVGVMEYGRWRPLGMTGHNESSPASLRLHGKFFLTEMDFRTEYSDSWGQDANEFRKTIYMTKTPEEAANEVRRDLGSSLAQFQGGWIYALPGNSWVGAEHLNYLEEAAKAAMRCAVAPQPEDRGQMAVFMDGRIRAYASEWHTWGPLMHYMGNYIPRTSLNRSGVTWDDYLLSDLDNPRRPDYKLNLFTTAGTITPEQIRWVKENLQGDGHVVVFVNNAGWSFAPGFERNIRELTGMTVRADVVRHRSQGLVPTGDDPLSPGLGYLLSGYEGPTFYVDDPTATPLALLTDTGQVGAAVKRFPDWTSVYISVLGGFTPRFLQDLARGAGLTPVGPEDDVTYAGNGMLVLHALRSGEKTLHWEGKSDLTDLATGQTVARNAVSYTFPMEAEQTRWFRRAPATGGK